MTVASKLQSAAGTLAIFRHTLTDWQPDGVVTRARARTRGGGRGRCRCRRWFSPTAALRAAAAWVRARRGAARRGVESAARFLLAFPLRRGARRATPLPRVAWAKRSGGDVSAAAPWAAAGVGGGGASTGTPAAAGAREREAAAPAPLPRSCTAFCLALLHGMAACVRCALAPRRGVPRLGGPAPETCTSIERRARRQRALADSRGDLHAHAARGCVCLEEVDAVQEAPVFRRVGSLARVSGF